MTLIDLYFRQWSRRLIVLRIILIHRRLRLVKHALLNKALRIELLSDLDTQLKVLLHEVLQLLRPCLLSLFVKLDAIVMLGDLLDAPPEQLDHLGHVIGLPFELCLLVFHLFLFPYKALAELFAANSNLLFGI